MKQRSQYMYKFFIAKINSNIFLRHNIVQNSKEVYELCGYCLKGDEEEEEIVKNDKRKSALDL